MTAKDSKYLEEFYVAVEGWTDERFVTRQEIRDLAVFSLYLVNLAEQDGWKYDGHSLKMGTPMSVLVVRATIDGVAHVVFSSGRTTTGCIRAFLRKLDEGWLEWQVDRFR